MKYKKHLLKLLYIFIGFLLVIGIWDLIHIVSSNVVFPEFFHTLYTSLTYLGNKEVLINTGYSLLRIILITLISTILGYILGTLASFYKPLGEILKPLIYLLTAFPSACLIYILIIFTSITNYILVFLLTFPLIYKICYQGGLLIDNNYSMILSLEGKYKPKNLFRIYYPLNIPYLFIGFYQVAPLALKGELMSEIFMSNVNYKGLGILIREAATYDFDIDRLFALTLFGILLMAIIDLIFNVIVNLICKRYKVSKINLYFKG